MSPGFTPRPSLSARHGVRLLSESLVSPGFTPRPSLSGRPLPASTLTIGPVSPGFTPRPSLSVLLLEHRVGGLLVSPGFTPRPSLSVAVTDEGDCGEQSCVAGVHAPAFVERVHLANSSR